jgi:hypothetical protein
VTRRFPLPPALVAILFALAVAAVASSSWKSPPGTVSPKLALTAQQLRLSQTSANQALIRLPNAKPGQMAVGATTVTVSGVRASVTVGVNNLSDIAGPNGGKLVASRRLWIDVRCAAKPCPGSPVAYRGPVGLMGTQSLGTWGPGTVRTYRVRVWLLRGGPPPSSTTGDNIFQGSSTKFGLIWRATGT